MSAALVIAAGVSGLIAVVVIVIAAGFLQREIGGLRQQLSNSLSESARLVSDSQKSIGERLDKAADVVGRVQASLGGLEQATQQVFAVGKNIAQLQDLLRAPKVRGAFGELFLGDLLAQILPAQNFTLQHAFKGGEIVDAVIRLGRLVPVDAKFPLENFRRITEGTPAEGTQARKKFLQDVRRHIDAIASKYLRPDEGTFDFALMYIPAENVYYEAIIKGDGDEGLSAYAFSKRVVPVSPNSLFAYLQTISLGLRGLQVEENARAILARIDALKNDFARFKEDHQLVGRHLSNARAKYEDADRRLGRFEDKLQAPGLESSSVETPELGLKETA
ncbi:MAG: DNA recombination protein RmuC [Elusimicrobia bacterium]|nr:DNA recombination protein RmuC [Elusimicrobiota bacterium]